MDYVVSILFLLCKINRNSGVVSFEKMSCLISVQTILGIPNAN